MLIAIRSNAAPWKGGAYQYSLALLDALASLPSETAGDFNLVLRSKRETQHFREYASRWRNVQLPFWSKDRFTYMIEASIGEGLLRDIGKRSLYRLSQAGFIDATPLRSKGSAHRFLTSRGIDWSLFTTPSPESFETGLPYVMPVFDLQHRLQPEFPEVSANGEWDRREYLYRNGTRHATLILADSEVGKADILECYGRYGITEDRVKVLPYVPPPYLSSGIRSGERDFGRPRYQLPERYFFYPAQLWPHKNHVRLVQAMGLLKEQGREIHLVLCGAHGGAIRTRVFQEVMREARRVKVETQLHYLGYVDNMAMSALYAGAVGLAMPTFFGPTNIPIVEAWLLGCPVLTSDIRGIREQVGDAGLLVDPTSVEAIADGMQRLWNHEGLRAELAQHGLRRLAAHDHAQFCRELGHIVSETNLRIGKRTLRSERTLVSA